MGKNFPMSRIISNSGDDWQAEFRTFGPQEASGSTALPSLDPFAPVRSVPGRVQSALDQRPKEDSSGAFKVVADPALARAVPAAAPAPLYPQVDASLVDDDRVDIAGENGQTSDGSIVYRHQLESAGYLRIGNAWFSPKEQRRGLHCPIKDEVVKRVMIGMRIHIQEILRPHPLQVHARPRVWTLEQYTAVQNIAQVRQATSRIHRRLGR